MFQTYTSSICIFKTCVSTARYQMTVLARYNILKVHASKIKLAPGNTMVINTYTSLHTCTHSLCHEALSSVHVPYIYFVFVYRGINLETIARVTPGLSGLWYKYTFIYIHVDVAMVVAWQRVVVHSWMIKDKVVSWCSCWVFLSSQVLTLLILSIKLLSRDLLMARVQYLMLNWSMLRIRLLWVSTCVQLCTCVCVCACVSHRLKRWVQCFKHKYMRKHCQKKQSQTLKIPQARFN